MPSLKNANPKRRKPVSDHRVFGLHAVQNLLNSTPDRINKLFLVQERSDHKLKKIRHLAERADISIEIMARKKLDNLVEGNHQGVVADCRPGETYDEAFLTELIDRVKAPLILVLDGVTDPHNLGACLRSAEAAGVHAVVVPRDNAVGITSIVSKVASGAAEIVPLITVTNLARTLQTLQGSGLWIAGAAGEATQSYTEIDFTGPTVIAMGAEGKGLRRLTRETCDYLIKIPMAGQVSSLNVSVATGILLFEVQRQRLIG
ncbi:23S rRNA (guanosine(2251)-2'-O)-methyltransferase RlmB [bacterium]|nr:23S rRNA (guanosine(2251)-2'-O)-methyltransferase RlmB [bacterium]